MTQLFSRAIACLAIALTCQMASADVTLPNIFSDSMVLQRDHANAVWGKASPGESVTVTIDSQKHSATADDAGHWRVTLDPMSVGEPRELVVNGKNEIRLTDVLVGEVWICSGQSNMQWSVNGSTNFALEQAAANHPTIHRYLRNGRYLRKCWPGHDNGCCRGATVKEDFNAIHDTCMPGRSSKI